ncbi:hypothetical protein QYF68_00775, partial [Mycolicibacterium austroafricanum]|nr:hypothetical protein [Mycolicibacterium austroafricanum]
LATLSWVHWHNTARLHGYLNDLPPTEFEAIFYATKRTDQPLVNRPGFDAHLVTGVQPLIGLCS